MLKSRSHYLALIGDMVLGEGSTPKRALTSAEEEIRRAGLDPARPGELTVLRLRPGMSFAYGNGIVAVRRTS